MKIKLEMKEFDLAQLLEEIVNDSILIDTSHTYELETSSPLLIRADFSLIKQVVRILIDNNMKYTQDNRNIKIRSCASNKKAIIEVIDNASAFRTRI